MQQHLESWKELYSQFQKPFDEVIALNVKTFQKMAYLKPDELKELKKPEDILDKNISLLIKNGHLALDYMQQVLHIMESNLLNMTKSIKPSSLC